MVAIYLVFNLSSEQCVIFLVTLDQLIRNCDTRLAKNEDEGIDEVQELVDLVKEVLPPPPANPDNGVEVKTAEDQQEMQDDKMTETN